MGDEELNFTESEARCWAGDPRNQATRVSLFRSALLVIVVFGIALLMVAWLANSSGSEPHRPTLGFEPAAPTATGHGASVPVPGLRIAAPSGSIRNAPAAGGYHDNR